MIAFEDHPGLTYMEAHQPVAVIELLELVARATQIEAQFGPPESWEDQ